MLSKKALKELKKDFYKELSINIKEINFKECFNRFIENNKLDIPEDVLKSHIEDFKDCYNQSDNFTTLEELDDKVFWYKKGSPSFVENLLKFNKFEPISRSSILYQYKDDYKTSIVPDETILGCDVSDLRAEYLFIFNFESFETAVIKFFKPLLTELNFILKYDMFITDIKGHKAKLRYRKLFISEFLAKEWESLYKELYKAHYKIYKDISCKFDNNRFYDVKSKIFKYVFDFLLEGFFDTFSKARVYKIDRSFLLRVIKPLYKKDFWQYDNFETDILPVLKMLEANI